MKELTLNLKLPVQIQTCSSEDVKRKFEYHLLGIIEETFIETADEDYVWARMLLLNKNSRMFFWGALQALEKYFKALLLQQGISVESHSHSLVQMFDENKTIFSFFRRY